MPNELPIPDELLSLIEKREGEDRRESERRASSADDSYAGTERREMADRRQQRFRN